MPDGKKVKFSRIEELAYELKVEQVMTKNVTTISPKNKITELREILRTKRISGCPVVDDDKLVGIISIEDLIKCLAEGDVDARVEEKMTKEIETLYSDEPLVYAVSKFSKYGFGRFPVIERESEKLVGILTKSDMIKGVLRKLEIDYHEEEIHRYRASHIFEDITADKITLLFQYDIVGQDFKTAGEAASGLRKTLSRLGFHPQILRRVAIATYEAEMNVVIFTSGGQILAEVEPKQIRIETIDSGPGIANIEQAMKPGFSTAPTWVRELGFGAGMGLPNIKNCVDTLDISSKLGEGTKLEFTLYMK